MFDLCLNCQPTCQPYAPILARDSTPANRLILAYGNDRYAKFCGFRDQYEHH